MTLNEEARPGLGSPTPPVLGGRYALGDLLGSGGSGAVYRARDLLLERDVAVKLLHPGQDEVARIRLRSEARIAGALTHPGIARLLDLGENRGPTGDVPYLVMEYVTGRTLREVMRSGERLSTEQVLRLLGQISSALAAVHAAGIIHRDLKPGNIMLTDEGRAVLLDFGIARHVSGEPLTMTGTIIGTVDYISPEQASGASATPASDLYALGTLAYEALTGLRPLNRDTQVSTLMAHATTPMPPLPPSFPAGVRELVAAMVALDPADRPSGARAVADRVAALLDDPHGTRPVTGAAPRRGGSVLRRRHLVAAACAVLLAAVGGIVLTSRSSTPVVAPAAADATTRSTTGSPSPSTGAGSGAASGSSEKATSKATSRATLAAAHATPTRPVLTQRSRGSAPAKHARAHHRMHPKAHPQPHPQAHPKPHPKAHAKPGPKPHPAKGPGHGPHGPKR